MPARGSSRRRPRGSARPGSPVAGRTTPTSCSPTCSASSRVPPRARRRRSPARPRGVRRAGGAPRSPRAAPAPDRHGARSGTSSCAVGPGVFVPATRDRAAGRLGRRAAARASRPAPGRGRPVHRLRGDRAGGRRRGAGAARARGRARRAGPRLGRAQPRRHRRRPAPGRHRRRRSTTSTAPVDVVVCNPPYIPLEAWESVAAEVRDHDPAARAVLRRRRPRRDAGASSGARPVLLRPGGVVGVEHADVQGESAPAVFAGTGRWEQVRDHRDLAGRARFVTARLAR